MKISCVILESENIEEKLSDKLGAMAMAGVLGVAGLDAADRFSKIPAEPPSTAAEIEKDLSQPKPANRLTNPTTITDSKLEHVLRQEAIKADIRGVELAQFLAQMKHESWNFTKMEEHEKFHGYFNRYDPKHKPSKARVLGNTHPGDGRKFRGRGYIQLTGRYNYRVVGNALGIDLINYPDLASDPIIAADIAVYYWKQRVSPRVEDFADTRKVTRYINSALAGLNRREENFQKYLETFNQS